MYNTEHFFELLRNTPLSSWLETLPATLRQVHDTAHGDLPRWEALLEQLPQLPAARIALDRPAITIEGETDDETRTQLEALLRQFQPWRKGPFDIHGIYIDSEWRSDLKWERLKTHIAPLSGRRVLDAGCGNGYHCWRMAGAGAELVIGIDPFWLYVMQFRAIRHFIPGVNVFLLPLGSEALPPALRAFDTVFSMGVFYHRRSPIDHLRELRGALRPGGELVLETLVVEGDGGQVLLPESRYARMHNVWFIPSSLALEIWLKRCGFRRIRRIDLSPTTPAEQRRTGWMPFDSLAEALDPQDSNRTVEGHPAPRRAIFLADA